MQTAKTIIGVINDYDDTHLCTAEDLKNELRDDNRVYDAKKYCDFRYATDLIRFIYDPYNGKKINWKQIYEYLKED